MLIVIWVVIVGVVVGLLAWFGPRPSQWRTPREDEKSRSRPRRDEAGDTNEDHIDET